MLYKLMEKKYMDNPNLVRKMFKQLLEISGPDMALILLEVLKNAGENTDKLISTEKLVSSYVETSYEETRQFIIEELKKRNFNLDNLIFA